MLDPGVGMRSGGFDVGRGVLSATARTGSAPAYLRPSMPPALGPRPCPAYVPLAPAQERIWHAARLGRSADWNVARAMRLRGAAVDVAALRGALKLLVARHDPLRTRYPVTELGPAQQVVDPGDVVLDVAECEVAEAEFTDE